MEKTAENSRLRLPLKNYLRINDIPLLFINFQKSLIREYSGGREISPEYQILVLERPDLLAFEIKFLEWPYSARSVLLVYNCSSEKVSIIPLKFSFKFAGREKESDFDFCYYHSLKIYDGQILITQIGQELDSQYRCLDIALFRANGKLISVWKTENNNPDKTNISDFHQLGPNYWLANIAFNQGIKNKPSIPRLYVLSLNQPEVIELSLGRNISPRIGSLLASETQEIKSWFSERIDGIPHFFVLASHYQICAYRLNEEHQERKDYDKIADLTLNYSLVKDIKVVLTDDFLTIEFNDAKLQGQGCFVFHLENK